MTRTESVKILEDATLDLKAYSQDYPEMRHRLAILSPAGLLLAGLTASRHLRTDLVAVEHLRTLAASAARALRETCERHPEIGHADSRVWDVVYGLETVAGIQHAQGRAA